MSKRQPNFSELDWGQTLNDHLSHLMNENKGGFNSWSNTTRPWENGDTTRDDMDKYTGLNFSTGKFEIWNASTRTWMFIPTNISPTIFNGTGTVYGDWTGDVFRTKGIGTKFTLELEPGDTILVNGSDVLIKEVESDVSAISEPFYREFNEPLGQTFQLTKGSMLGELEDTSLINEGDLIYDPNSYSFSVLAIVNATTVVLHREAWWTGTVTDASVLKPVGSGESTSFIVYKAPISCSSADGDATFSVSPFGVTNCTQIKCSRDWEDSDYIEGTEITTKGYYNLEQVSNPTAISLSSEMAVQLGQTVAYAHGVSLGGSIINSPDGASGGNIDVYRSVHCGGGNISSGHVENFTQLYLRPTNWNAATIGTAIGLSISSLLGYGGTVDKYHPICENGGGNLPPGVPVSNYFASDTGIGTTSPTAKLHVIGNIVASGTVSWSSDERLKENVSPLTGSLDKICNLQGVSFEWVDPEKHGDSEGEIGLIAQNVQAEFPLLVEEDKEGYKHLKYANLTAPLIEAVKELRAIVEAQALEIEGLKKALGENK